MTRLRWPLLILLICLPVALLAAGYRLPGRTPEAVPEAVPAGDRELAWFNTTTAGATWERFVAGAIHAQTLVAGLSVDDSEAFPDQTTDVPEVVLNLANKPGRVHVRWYKLNNDHTPAHWMAVLGKRTPAPLAIIGGGSSDRAADLAWALKKQEDWHGDRPLFFMTNATAENVDSGDDAKPLIPLLEIYKGRTYRVCFSNRQMAAALLDFVWQSPGLRPQAFRDTAKQALLSGLYAPETLAEPPAVFRISWDDDPFSDDLQNQFSDAFPKVLTASRPAGEPAPEPYGVRWHVPFSVGGFYAPNRVEAETAANLAGELRKLPAQRSLLIIPTVAAPARRLVRALCEADAGVGPRLVAINGDGMGANTILRDGEFAWPVHALPVPLLLFTHNNPAGGDADPTTSTDDVLHYAEILRLIASSAFGPAEAASVATADELKARLDALNPPYFNAAGSRRGSTGEYILLLKPRSDADAFVEVWRRDANRSWVLVRGWPLRQSRSRP